MRKGEHPLPPERRRLMARLVLFHYATRPDRIARLLGVRRKYVSKKWDEVPYADLDKALAHLVSMLGPT